jgi:anti-anti-sigma regulatory factor
MSWQNEPKIDSREQDGVTVLHVEGDLIFDLPSEWRQMIIESLDEWREHDRVVIDLAGVDRLASWGEKRIKSFVGAVLGHDGRVAVVIDPHRSAMYAGLRVELGRFDPPIPIVGALDEALASLKVPR